MKKRYFLGILGMLGILGILLVGLSACAQDEKTTIGNKTSEVFWQFLKKLPDKTLEIMKSAIKKMTDIVRGSSNVDIKQWFNNRKEAIKQGLKEEMQELKQDIASIIKK